MTWLSFRRSLHRHDLKTLHYLYALNAVPFFDVTSIRYDFWLAEDIYRMMETHLENISVG